MNRFLSRLIVALLLGVAVYGVYVVYSGYQAVADSLATFEARAMLFALLLASTNYLIRFLKWEYYLALLGIRGVGKGDSLLIFLSGFILTVTPGKVGEVFKSAVLQSTHGVPLERTAPIVVAERLTDALGIVVLILIGSLGFPSGWPWALAGALVTGFGLAMILWEPPARFCLGLVARGPARFRGLVPKLEQSLISLRVVASPRAILWPTLLSVVAWACEGLALWVLLAGFGTPAPWPVALFFYSTATLAGAIVPVPGGLGVTETILREGLVQLAHIPNAQATASMILVRLATLWWAVLVGFMALALLRARYPEKLAGVTAEPAE